MKFRRRKKPGKTPTKRPLYVYYIIVGVIIVLLNILVVPAIQERSIGKNRLFHILLKVWKRAM